MKTRWGLTADPAEKATLAEIAANCPNISLAFATVAVAYWLSRTRGTAGRAHQPRG